MHLLMILVIFIILFGSTQTKGFIWLAVGALFLLIIEPKAFLSILFILIIVIFIVYCIAAVDDDFKELKTDNNIKNINNQEYLNSVQVQNKKNQVSSTPMLKKKIMSYNTNAVYQDFGDAERENALSTNYNGDFEKFINDYGIPTHISVIDSKNSLAFYKNLDLIVIYNSVTKQIIKRESTR